MLQQEAAMRRVLQETPVTEIEIKFKKKVYKI